MSPHPDTFGRYEVLGSLGRGAMGEVFHARDREIGRDVALKTYRVGPNADEKLLAQLRKRLRREARSAGRISHPNVVAVYDVVGFEDEAGFFIVMEYVEGQSLADILADRGRLDLDEVLPIFRQTAEAVDHLHAQGVIHRDLKPANILLTPDGRVKITDFGIARPDDDDGTHETTVFGTPRYMAPEQIRGDAPSPATDVFALGVVLYEVVTGAKPFSGRTVAEVTHRILSDSPTPIEEVLDDEESRAVCRVVDRALAHDPADRYPSAKQMLWDLTGEGPTQSELDTAQTSVLEPRDRVTVGRRWKIGTSVALAAVAAFALVWLGIVSLQRSSPSSEVAVRTDAYSQVLAEGRRALAMGDPDSAVVLFRTAAQLTPDPTRARELEERAMRAVAERGAEAKLAQARDELATGEIEEAVRIARELLAMDSTRSEAMILLEEIEKRLAETTRGPARITEIHPEPTAGAGRDREAPTAAEGPEGGPEGEPASPRAEPASEPSAGDLPAATPGSLGTASLAVRMTTRAPRGVLSLYVGDEQVLVEPFSFAKGGWFRRGELPGTIEAEIPIPADVAPLRVLITRNGQQPSILTYHTRFEAGSEREILIEIPETGKPDIRLD